MFRILIFIIIAGVVYWFWKKTMDRYAKFKKNFQQKIRQNSIHQEGNSKMSELVQDPQCKLYIAKESAIFYKGQYFCSEDCKNSYLKSK